MKSARLQIASLWALLGLVVLVGVGSYYWMTAPGDPDWALMRYVRPVTNAVSSDELQRWAVSLLQEHRAELSNTNEQTPLLSDVPPLVRAIPTLGFAPARISLARAGRESAHEDNVHIVYLGGFGSWGICVGSSTFRLEEGPHCYEWIPGVYIVISP